MNEKRFLQLVERLTGEKKENIKIIWFEMPKDGHGQCQGVIEVEGIRKYLVLWWDAVNLTTSPAGQTKIKRRKLA